MRKLKLLIGLAAAFALPALASTPALAADSCPPSTTVPAYCPYTPAPTVVTGPLLAVSRTGAIISGTINPHGASVTYTFEYGTTAAYGSTTTFKFLAATSNTVTVTATILGLAPGTTFHYRLVATNNAHVTGVGLDRTFTTPTTGRLLRLKTTLSLKGRPKHDSHRPYAYRFSGKVKIPAGTVKSSVCGGRVTLRLTRNGRLIASGHAKVSKSCTFAKTVHIKRTRLRHGSGKLKVVGRYGGNTRLKPSQKTISVRYG